MIATRDHGKVSQTTLRCCVRNQFIVDGAVDLGDQHYTAEYPQRSIGLAKRWVEQTMLKHGRQDTANPDVIWQGDIRVGTYTDVSFYDEARYGHVSDAAWEERRQGPLYDASFTSDGEIEWEEYQP